MNVYDFKLFHFFIDYKRFLSFDLSRLIFRIAIDFYDISYKEKAK